MKAFNKIRWIPFVLAMFLAAMMALPAKAAETTMNLGNAASFEVLAGTEINNTGTTKINGNVGVSPGAIVTGLTSDMISEGAIHCNDAVADLAQKDLVLASRDAMGRTNAKTITTDLGEQTLTPGVYFLGLPATLTGTLKLDAQGDPEAVFIFQMASTLTTQANSKIELINGARFSRIFWQVGTHATLGASSTFKGSILADNAISAGPGTMVQGQLLAIAGGVALNSNQLDAVEIIGEIPKNKNTIDPTESIPTIETPSKESLNPVPEVFAKNDPITLNGEGEGDTYKVTIEWGTMTFNYNLGTWNPEFHSWVGGGWDDGNFDGVNDQIKITNESTQPVDATFAYTAFSPSGGDTTGTFTPVSGNLKGTQTGIMTLAELNGTAKTYLNLQGSPVKIGSTPVKIGSLSVTLNSAIP